MGELGKSLGELAVAFGCELDGDPDVTVSRVATLSGAGEGDISFLANKMYAKDLQSTGASAVVLSAADAGDCPTAALITGNPYLTYARIAAELHPDPALQPGIGPGAVVDGSAIIPDSVQVAANAVIGEAAEIGEGVYIGPGVVIGPRCSIGAGSRILANVSLVQDVTMGERCIIHPGAVIGGDGFGNAMSDEGWVKVPQVGGVRLGNDVEIGSNTTIDRGAIEDTVIGNGVRIDNLVQIAHNVQIGDHTAMAALSGSSGSTVIGKRCMFGGQSGLVGHISICDDVIIGGATVIYKDITEPGFYTGSFPGEENRAWKRKVARFRKLDEFADRIAALEKRAKNDGE